MKLDPEARDAVNAALTEAHAVLVDKRVRSRHVASRFVTLIRDMEPSGAAWIPVYLDELAIVGAMKVCADWRRTKNGTAKTRKGTNVAVPLWSTTTDDQGEPVLSPFDALTADELRIRMDQMEAQRDTLSRELRLYADLLEAMEAPGVDTVGQALAAMGQAA